MYGLSQQYEFLVPCCGDQHTVVLRGASGPTFSEHNLAADGMSVEAALMDPQQWGCHYLARWWLGKSDFWCCIVRPGKGERATVVFDTQRVLAVLRLTCTRPAAEFLHQLIRKYSPTVEVKWELQPRVVDKLLVVV